MKRAFPIIAIVLSLACSFGQTTPTPAPQPTAPSLPTVPPPTETAALPPTELPAPTDTPQVFDIPQTSDPLSIEGPWLIIHGGEAGLWAANADGTGLTQIVAQPVLSSPNNVAVSLSPTGGHVAFITADDPQTNQGLKLHIVTVPEGDIQTITPLFPPDVVPFTGDNFGADSFEAMRAIVDYDSLAWSPNGDYLAFISAHDGPSSDVYVYDLVTRQISRLTDGPSQAYGLSWSPDSLYIVHAGVSSFGTGAGYGLVGMWAVPVDGRGLLTLNPPGGADVKVLGWIASNVFIVHSWSVICGESDLRFYNLLDNSETRLLPGCFSHAVFDPGSHALGFIAAPQEADEAGTIQPGLYIVPPEANQGLRVAQNIVRLEWSQRYGQFHAFTDSEVLAFSPGGTQVPVLTETFVDLPGEADRYKKAWLPGFEVVGLTDGNSVYVADDFDRIARPVQGVPYTYSVGWLLP